MSFKKHGNKLVFGILFATNHGVVPENLITVHIPWCDQYWDMDFPPIDEYIHAIHNLMTATNTASSALKQSKLTNIYLATEDPKAYEKFMLAKPKEWIVYSAIHLLEISGLFCPNKGNSWKTLNTKGQAGLVALGSLLVAMEANQFVLTTKSAWRLMNHLQSNIIDPRCGHCTTMIDLKPGENF